MARGFASGLFWGGITGVVIAAASSVIASWPVREGAGVDLAQSDSVSPAVVAQDVATPSDRDASSAVNAVEEAGEVNQSEESQQSDELEQTETAEATTAPEDEPDAKPGATETEPATENVAENDPSPVVSESPEISNTAPNVIADVIGSVEVAGEDANAVSAQASNETAPRVAQSQTQAPVIASDEGAEPLDVVRRETSPALVEAPKVSPQSPSETAQIDLALADDTPAYPSPQAVAPQTPDGDNTPSISDASERPSLPAPSVPVAPVTDQEASATPVPDQPAGAGATAPQALVIAPSDSALPVPENPEQPASTVATETLEPEPEPKPNTNIRVGSLVDRDNDNVVVGAAGSSRLPSIRTEASTGKAATDAAEAEAPSSAKEFKNPDNKPMFAVVLIDTGEASGGGEIDLEKLADFPFPINIAVDASAPNAADRAKAFQAKGFDILAMIDLPETATASDVEVTMSVLLGNLPDAIGILEGTQSGFQANRDISDQVTDIANDENLGIIWQPKGLDTAQKLAARDGVASKTLFRDFDGAGQNARAMTRFLQNAAVRAGQQGGAVMLGRLRPETVSTLLEWGVQERSGRIIFAPIRAVFEDAK